MTFMIFMFFMSFMCPPSCPPGTSPAPPPPVIPTAPELWETPRVAHDDPRLPLTFGAYLAYSPRGIADASRISRSVCYGIKHDAGGTIERTVRRLKREFAATPLASVLGPRMTLVPAPRSAPLLPGGLWPARRIADELVKVGLGREVLPAVTRTTPVGRSAVAGAGMRVSPHEHLASMALEPLIADAVQLTIVDDVVTRGATLLAMAVLLTTRFRDVPITAFAVVRTVGLQAEIPTLIQPCVGTICLDELACAVRQP